MKSATSILLAFALLAMPLPITANPLMVLAGTKHAAASAYELAETFEGSNTDSQGETGYDLTGWTSSIAGNTPRYTTSPAPLAGTYSWLPGTNGYLQRNFTTSGSFAAVYVRFVTTSQTANDSIIVIRDGSGVLASAQLRATNLIRVQCAAGAQSSGTTACADSTEYHAWLEYTAGSGANAVVNFYLSTTSTKPGSPTLSITNGSATANATNARIAAGSTTVVVFDNFVMDGTQAIGSAPL